MFKKHENEIETGAAQRNPNPSASSSPHPRPDLAPTPTKGAQAVIGPSIVIKGEISGQEDVLVHGRVEGTVKLVQNNLTVGSGGFAKADVHAMVITVEGEVEGDLTGDERVIIRSSGTIRGNILAPRVSLEDGAKFKGSIDMDVPRAASQESPVKPVATPAPREEKAPTASSGAAAAKAG